MEGTQPLYSGHNTIDRQEVMPSTSPSSGCSKGIISEDNVRALGASVRELDRPLRIVSSTGDNLDNVGTCNVYIKTKVKGKGRTMLNSAVLRENKAEKEVLVRLKNMKKFRIIPGSLCLENIDDSINKSYYTAYLVHQLSYYQPTKCEVKEPSKEHKQTS